MVDVHVKFYQASYLPGQTVKTTITLARHRSLNNHGPRSPATTARNRRHSRSGSNQHSFSVHDDQGARSPTSPTSAVTSPTSIMHSPNTEKQARPKSKSVSFSPAISPTHARRGSRTKVSYFPNEAASDTSNETLLIVYAQLHGQFTINDNFVVGEPFEHLRGQGIDNLSGGGLVSNSTITHQRWSFGSLTSVLAGSNKSSLAELRHAAANKDMPVLSMPPAILAIELSLSEKAEEHDISFELPSSLPPSFSGKSMTTAYMLKLSAQHQDNSTTIFECPVRVLPDPGASYNFLQPHLLTRSSAVVTKPSSEAQPPTKSISTKKDFLDFLDALDSDRALPSPIEERTAILPRTPSLAPRSTTADRGMQLDVSRGKNEHVCKVFISKSSFKPGEVVSGTVDFRAAQLRCFAFTVSLESAESIDPEYTSATLEQIEADTKLVHGHERVITAATLSTTFEIGVPVQAPNSFKTMPLALQYSLLFKFIIHEQESLMTELRTKHGIEAFPVEDVMGESFECRVPITIRTTISHETCVRTGHL